MDQQKIELLFALLRCAIRGDRLTEKERALYTEERAANALAVAGKHDVSHLAALGLEKNGLSVGGDAQTNMFMAVYRYETLKYELEQLCQILEEAKIDFMPLKGPILRRYYPEPWMRTSCDIDILVHEEDLDRAAELLTTTRGYKIEGKGSHDISMFSKDQIHFELHYTLIEDGMSEAACQMLRNVWNASKPLENKHYHYEMTEEMFYFYHILHMAKHFEGGGCGVRPFIDLWILDHIDGADRAKRDEFLKKGELLCFAEMARLLSCVWLDHAKHTDITRQMENYILRGGVYGTAKNRISVQQQKQGGRLRYMISRVFIPYDTIKFHYPVLQKHRWLTPVMEVRRWFKLVFCGHAKRVVDEIKVNQAISHAEAENIQMFLKNIGL